MEFLKLDKERENPPEELQSMLLSVCLSVCWYSLCVGEHVPVHTSILVPPAPYTHTHHTHPPTLTDIVDFTSMVSTRVCVWSTWSEAYSNESSASTHESLGMRP